MRNKSTGSIWLTLAVIIVGVGSLLALHIQPRREAATVRSSGEAISLVSSTPEESLILTPTPIATAPDLVTMPVTRVLLPTPTMTPLPPVLPEVPVPENGQIYLLRPASPAVLGWARASDDLANHFGDYNIFSGVFDGEQYVGAMQFDLSMIAAGSPILYADLTITGLAKENLEDTGIWTVQMLHDWMDANWVERDFYWLAREDSGTVPLSPQISTNELDMARPNTFSIAPEGLSLLEARLFTGHVSFRILGPKQGPNNLFGWDSGFGERSLGRPPILRIVTGGPAPAEVPSPTPNFVIMTPTAADGEAILAMAAERLTATAVATPVAVTGTPMGTLTPTPLPPNWVTPIVVTNTPTPETEVTAIWQAQVATAQAIVWGTATATPPNVWTATPTPLPPAPTATPMIVAYDLLTPTPTPTVTPSAIPDLLRGKILFYSDRAGREELMVMDPDGSNVAVWTGGAPDWIYAEAKKGADRAPDGRYQVVVSDEQIMTLQLWTIDLQTGVRFQLTHLDDVAYDPIWSPSSNTIAFVSPAPGNDEIFLIHADGTGLTQLTFNEWEWDKHPSWSPDGSRMVFWSNRETRRQQIWIMNADGTNVHNLSNNDFNDWDPVWVK